MLAVQQTALEPPACHVFVPSAHRPAWQRATRPSLKRRCELQLLQAPDGPPNSRLYWGGPEGERVLTLMHGGDRRLLPLSCPVAPGVWAVFDQDAIAEAAAGDLAMASRAEGGETVHKLGMRPGVRST